MLKDPQKIHLSHHLQIYLNYSTSLCAKSDESPHKSAHKSTRPTLQCHPLHPAIPPRGWLAAAASPLPPAFCHPAMPRCAGGSGTRSRSCRVFPPPSRLFCLAAGVVGGGAGKASWSRMASLTHPAALAAARRRAPPTHAASSPDV